MYEVKDPWRSRLRQGVMRVLVCSWRGHDPVQKMYGPGPCRRCD